MALTLEGTDNLEKKSPLELSHEKADKFATDEEFLKDILSEIDKDNSALKPFKTSLNKWTNQYKGITTDRNYQGLANLFIPETLKAVETIVSIVHGGIFGSPTFVRFAGREQSDDASAENMTDLVHFQIGENQFELNMGSFVRQMCIYGTGVAKIMWDFKKKKKKLRVKGENGPEIKESFETVKDYWTFEPVDLLHLVLPLKTPWTDIRQARYVAEVRMVDAAFIRDKVSKNWFSKKALDVIKSPHMSRPEEDVREEENKRLSDSGFSPRTESKVEEWSYIERWGLVPNKYVKNEGDDGEDEDLVPAVIGILNRDTVIKLEKIEEIFWHNELPYVSCPFIPLEHEFFGMGVCQITESLQMELNDTRNQTMDNKTLILSCMWIADQLSGLNTNDMVVEPNKIIRVRNMEGLKPLQPPVLTGVGVNIEGVIKEDIRQSVSAVSGLQGVQQPGVGSATEFQGLQSSALSRSKMLTGTIGKVVLHPVFNMAAHMNNQYYDHQKLIRIIGENGIKQRFMKPEDIWGSVDAIVELSTDFDNNPNVTNQQLLSLFTTLVKMPPDLINLHWNMLNRVAKSLGQKNFEQDYPAPITADSSILLTPEEELTVMLENQPASVKPGDNHMEHLQKHGEDHERMAMGMTPIQADLLAAHIRDHMQYVKQMEKQATMPPPNLGVTMQQNSGGQTQNASPTTMTQPANDNALRRGIEG